MLHFFGLSTELQIPRFARNDKLLRYVPIQILFFAMTTAPMIATSNSNDAISKANM